MDFRTLDIVAFVNFLYTYDDRDNLNELLIEYFSYRVFNVKICDIVELDYLEKFVYDIKNNIIFSNKNKKGIVMNEISKLIILSKNIDLYKRFDLLLNKGACEFSNEEIIEYIDIILKNCYCCFVVSKFDIYFRRYFELGGSLDDILNLIDSNSFVFSKRELRYVNRFLYENYINVILRNMNRELECNIINGHLLFELFNKLDNIKIGDIGVNNLKLLRNILELSCDENINFRIDDGDLLLKFKIIRDKIRDNIFNSDDENKKIRNSIILQDIIIFNSFSDDVINNIKILNYRLPICDDRRIITIDDPMSPDLDGAFSISRNMDGYILDVYISDVPIFLRDNRILCKEAFFRGCTMYVRDLKNGGNINIDMLPKFLSHHYLSLNVDGYKNVIKFRFLVDYNGIVELSAVDREKIIINNKLSPDIAKKIIFSKIDSGALQEDLINYKNLCKLVCSSSENKFLRNLNCNNIADLVGFTSVLVNYYIGNNALFAIYRESGKYTNIKQSGYTHSVTPLRRFVSNINLAFFLEQYRVVSFFDKDLYYVQDNIDEIVMHLNERDKLSKFVEKNSSLVKKYIRFE